MKKILYNMDNISDKNIAQKILFNLVTMTELTEKDLKLFKNIEEYLDFTINKEIEKTMYGSFQDQLSYYKY